VPHDDDRARDVCLNQEGLEVSDIGFGRHPFLGYAAFAVPRPVIDASESLVPDAVGDGPQGVIAADGRFEDHRGPGAAAALQVQVVTVDGEGSAGPTRAGTQRHHGCRNHEPRVHCFQGPPCVAMRFGGSV